MQPFLYYYYFYIIIEGEHYCTENLIDVAQQSAGMGFERWNLPSGKLTCSKLFETLFHHLYCTATVRSIDYLYLNRQLTVAMLYPQLRYVRAQQLSYASTNNLATSPPTH